MRANPYKMKKVKKKKLDHVLSDAVSKHLKGQLGPPVSDDFAYSRPGPGQSGSSTELIAGGAKRDTPKL